MMLGFAGAANADEMTVTDNTSIPSAIFVVFIRLFLSARLVYAT